MKIEDLEIFLDAMRLGSFAATAEHRNLDPSQVSRRMAALERELDCQLFERATRRFRPTAAGARYRAHIEPALDELRAAAAITRDLEHGPRGTIRIAASVAFAHEVLIPLTRAFRDRFPAVRLEFVLSDRHADLIEERLDLAIRLGPRPDGPFIAQQLMPVRHRVCASPDYIQRNGALRQPGDISSRDCVLFPFDGFRDQWLVRATSGQIETVPVDGSVLVSNALALKRCVLDGAGPGLLADWMIGADLGSGRLVDCLPDYDVTATTFDTAAWLVYAERDYVPAKLAAYLEFLDQHVGVPR